MTNPGNERLEVSRTVRADRKRVFDAWTDPSKITQWWGAGEVTCPEAEADVRVGGTYRIANQTPDGQLLWITGTYRHVEPPSKLIYTWTMGPITGTDHSLVEVTFDEVAGGTRITVSQTRIADAETREIHLGGWIGCLDGLDRLLTG